MEQLLQQILQKLDNLEKGQHVTNIRLESLEQGQQALEKGQQALEKGQRDLELGQQTLEQGQRATNQRLEALETSHKNLESSHEALIKAVERNTELTDNLTIEMRGHFKHIEDNLETHNNIFNLISREWKGPYK